MWGIEETVKGQITHCLWIKKQNKDTVSDFLSKTSNTYYTVSGSKAKQAHCLWKRKTVKCCPVVYTYHCLWIQSKIGTMFMKKNPNNDIELYLLYLQVSSLMCTSQVSFNLYFEGLISLEILIQYFYFVHLQNRKKIIMRFDLSSYHTRIVCN